MNAERRARTSCHACNCGDRSTVQRLGNVECGNEVDAFIDIASNLGDAAVKYADGQQCEVSRMLAALCRYLSARLMHAIKERVGLCHEQVVVLKQRAMARVRIKNQARVRNMLEQHIRVDGGNDQIVATVHDKY